jgi:hypothetical protein
VAANTGGAEAHVGKAACVRRRQVQAVGARGGAGQRWGAPHFCVASLVPQWTW